MDPTFLILLLLVVTSPVLAHPITSHITVTGSVFCDVCYNNSFTQHSYFLPGVDVHLQCKFQANAPKTSEQITFSANRTTNRYGVYRLDIPSVDGVDCVEGPAIESFCEATLIVGSRRSSSCSVPAVSTSSKEITVKSRSTGSPNLCVYSVSALTYTPSKRNSTLCGKEKQPLMEDTFHSSKFFLPYFPWPPLPQFPPWPSLPPLPPLPPFPSLPPLPQLPPFPSFPPLPQFPPFPSFPPLPQFPPFPSLPPLPQLPPLPPFTPAAPPVLNPGDPRSWIPPPPAPANPTTWMPFPIPPPPPGFNLRDPRTWFPPSPHQP